MRAASVGGLTALAWLGYVAHNAVDLPGLSPLSPEYSVVTLLYLGLFFAWWRHPGAITRRVLLGWAWLQLVGGGLLSVLPLPFLPFEPAQTLLHYGMHALLVATHIPLVLALHADAKRPEARG